MTIGEKIIRAIEEIPVEKLNELFSLVEDFTRKGASTPGGGRWERFFGIHSQEQVGTMWRVIERNLRELKRRAA